MNLKTGKFFLLIFFLLSFLSIFSCQTFPSGITLQEFQKEGVPSEGPVIETIELYRYFAMCRAVWRVREKWKKTDWALNYFYDKPTNTLGLTILGDDILYIAFRSSQALENAVDRKYNARVALRTVPFISGTKIKAHSGFLTKYSSIRNELLGRVQKAGVSHIRLIGHSGGGAMASIAFLDLKHQFPSIKLDAFVFGPVRTYNRHGADWFKEYNHDYIRIVNGRDPFSNLPPVIFGYRHIGRLVRMGIRPVYKVFSFKDHHPGYRTVLEDRLREEGIDPKKLDFY